MTLVMADSVHTPKQDLEREKEGSTTKVNMEFLELREKNRKKKKKRKIQKAEKKTLMKRIREIEKID
jgi:hypothetical protein